jgi:hypothetical protein
MSRFCLNLYQTGRDSARLAGIRCDQLSLLPGGPNEPVLLESLPDGPGLHQAWRVLGVITCFYYLGGPISRFCLNPWRMGLATTRLGG